MKQTISSPVPMPAFTCEPEWYISPFYGNKYKTLQNIEKDRKSGEASQAPVSSSTTSDDAVVEEVRQAIRAEFAKGLKSLGIKTDFTNCIWDQPPQMQNLTVRLAHIL